MKSIYDDLKDSCAAGDLSKVRAILACGANVNAANGIGYTALHRAADNGHREIVQFLLENGASVDVYVCKLFKPIHLAIQNGHEGVIEALIEAGDDFNTDTDRSTSLYCAVKGGLINMVKALIEAGADVNERCFHGWDLLHLAAYYNRAQIVKVLLDHGAHVDAVSRNHQTPLYYACVPFITSNAYMNTCRPGGEEAARVLIDAGANVHFRGIDRKTALHFAAYYGCEGAARLLIKSGARVNVRCANNDTPLHLAAAEGHDGVVKALLEHGANPELFNDPFHRTPLHVAAFKSRKNTVEVLLKCKANINAVDLEGSTALHLAAYLGFDEVVDVLLDYGPDVRLVLTTGRCALRPAYDSSRYTVIITSVLEHVLEVNADVNYHSIATSLLHAGFHTDAHGIPKSFRQLNECLKYSCFFEVCEKHFIKMKTAGLRPHKYFEHRNMPPGLSEVSRQQYQTACEQEFALTKSTKIGDSGCSYYRLFQNGEAVCRNENAVQTLQAQDWKKDFSIYGRLLNIRFRQGLERQNLLNECYHLFPFVFRVDLPFDILDKIYSYLTVRDLKNLSSILDRKRRPKKRRRARLN